MACRLTGTKPLSAIIHTFHSRKCIWKCRLAKFRPFCLGLNVLRYVPYSMWSSDAIWHHVSVLIQPQVSVWWLTAPIHSGPIMSCFQLKPEKRISLKISNQTVKRYHTRKCRKCNEEGICASLGVPKASPFSYDVIGFYVHLCARYGDIGDVMSQYIELYFQHHHPTIIRIFQEPVICNYNPDKHNYVFI